MFGKSFSKKVIFMLAMMIAMAGLTACGKKDGQAESEPVETVEAEEAAETETAETEETEETEETAAEETATEETETAENEEAETPAETEETAGTEAKGVTLEIGETVEKELWTQTTVYPDNIDDTFVIDVMLPDDYDETISYPVVYLTDCYWRRENYGEIKDLYESGKTKEFILVGIGYPDDYDFDTIRMRDLIEEPDKFLNLIITGVLPYAEENYNIDATDRTLAGASCGGYFTLYSLLQSDGLTKDVFKNYLLASAALTMETNGEGIRDFEERYFENNSDLKANVYMTAGADEEMPYMLRPNRKFVDRMEERNCPSLDLTYEEYEGKEHYTVWVPTLLAGLERFLAN